MVLARFLPRDEQFFDQFQESADNASEVTKALLDVVSNEADRSRNVHLLRDLEHRGDEITHRIFATTFAVSPNRESTLITALLIVLLMKPVTATDLTGVGGLVAASAWAVAS